MPALSQNLTFVINTSTSVVVNYPNTGTTTLIYKSEKIKGEGYFGVGDGLHTAAFVASPTFIGTITIQASLASEPNENDWFYVPTTTSTYTALNIRTTSTVDTYNFTGNYVWLRGVVSIDQGAVSKIQLNY